MDVLEELAVLHSDDRAAVPAGAESHSHDSSLDQQRSVRSGAGHQLGEQPRVAQDVATTPQPDLVERGMLVPLTADKGYPALDEKDPGVGAEALHLTTELQAEYLGSAEIAVPEHQREAQRTRSIGCGRG
jgi:hypothetical protein